MPTTYITYDEKHVTLTNEKGQSVKLTRAVAAQVVNRVAPLLKETPAKLIKNLSEGHRIEVIE